mmetsp:Transcript_8447/g.11393  ORF Transcript_8447/g.11393 Transcript_8447/m.11393 type:complete len:219 (+) Transcript_8447:2555-3211(+)
MLLMKLLWPKFLRKRIPLRDQHQSKKNQKKNQPHNQSTKHSLAPFLKNNRNNQHQQDHQFFHEISLRPQEGRLLQQELQHPQESHQREDHQEEEGHQEEDQLQVQDPQPLVEENLVRGVSEPELSQDVAVVLLPCEIISSVLEGPQCRVWVLLCLVWALLCLVWEVEVVLHGVVVQLDHLLRTNPAELLFLRPNPEHNQKRHLPLLRAVIRPIFLKLK